MSQTCFHCSKIHSNTCKNCTLCAAPIYTDQFSGRVQCSNGHILGFIKPHESLDQWTTNAASELCNQQKQRI